VDVQYLPGCGVEEAACDAAALAALLAAAASADVVVVCVGERNYAEKPGNIDDLAMGGAQRQMLAALGQQVRLHTIQYGVQLDFHEAPYNSIRSSVGFPADARRAGPAGAIQRMKKVANRDAKVWHGARENGL
jgi:hypothetical protein